MAKSMNELAHKSPLISSSKGEGHEKGPQDAATAASPTRRLLAVLEKR